MLGDLETIFTAVIKVLF